MKKELIDRIHQPEYTGENRCEACTVVNVVIAVIFGAIVSRKSKLAGILTVSGSFGLIYLRGYLVPGTPKMTKRYLPSKVLRWFGKEPEGPPVQSGLGATDSSLAAEPEGSSDASSTSGSSESGNEEVSFAETTETAAADPDSAPSPEEYFLNQDVLESCANEDDLCLTEEFTTAWNEEIEMVDTDLIDATEAARAFGFDDHEEDGAAGEQTEHSYEIEEFDDAQVLKQNEQTIGQWPSQAALIADVTAAHLLSERDYKWDTYPPEVKGNLLNGLRMFLETCPTSGGDAVIGTETVESCCQSHEVVAVTCEETGERLFEHRIDGVEV